MKHLFVLLIFISLKNGLQAQVTDSTTMKADSVRTGNMNNDVNSSPMKSDSTTTSMSNGMDSTHNVSANRMDTVNNSSNSTMANNSIGSSNMKGTMQNPMNVKGMQSYAALPVKESYIPDDVMNKITSKYGSGIIIYDVTAVRAAMPSDSSMQQPKDSSAMHNSPSDSTSGMTMSAAPIKYNYVVRTIKDGAIQTEYLADDATTAVMPGEMNKPQQ